MFGDPRLPARFWAKIDVAPGPLDTDCWLWTACQDGNGYGQINWEGRTRQAHVISYDTLVGAPPAGLDRDHLCRKRSCVNPGHLEPVTRRVNLLRGEGRCAQQAAKTHCDREHQFTPENIYIRPDGTRKCRACHRDDERERYRARKVAA